MDHHTMSGRVIAAMVVCGLPVVHNAEADDYHWQGAGTGGNTATDPADPATLWRTPANWLEGAPPAATDAAILTLTNDGTIHAQGAAIGVLRLDATSDAFLQIGPAVSLTTGAGSEIGVVDGGRVLLTGGMHESTGPFRIGCDPGSEATYELQSGTLAVHWSSETSYALVGDGGTGHLSQSGGLFVADVNLTLAEQAGSTATFEQQGGDVRVGWAGNPWTAYYGNGGTASVLQTAGTHHIESACVLGNLPDGSGTYRLEGGEFRCGLLFSVAGEGTGSFIQTGGAAVAAGGLSVGARGGADGSAEIHDGTMTVGVDGEDHALSIGGLGVGRFDQFGGTVTVHGRTLIGADGDADGTCHQHDGQLTTGSLAVGFDPDTHGTYQLDGGTLTVTGNTYVGWRSTDATFRQQGGTHECNGDLRVAHESGSAGEYVLGGGDLNVGGALAVGYYGSGGFTQSGGVNTVTGEFNVGHFAEGTGRYTLENGTLNLTGRAGIGRSGGGEFVQTGGTVNGGRYVFFGLSGDGSLRLEGGQFSGEHIYFGQNGDGTGTQTGGTLGATKGAYLGHNGGAGEYDMNGGEMSVDYIQVGRTSHGHLTVNGGTISAETNVRVGVDPGSIGLLEMNDGVLAIGSASSEYTGEFVGVQGQGTFIQRGGTHTIHGELKIGTDTGGQGRFEMHGGSLSATTVWVGIGGGVGQLVLAGGQIVFENLVVGAVSPASPGLLFIRGVAPRIEIAGDLVFAQNATFAAEAGAEVRLTGSMFDVRGTDPGKVQGMQNLTLAFAGEGDAEPFEVASADRGRLDAAMTGNFALHGLQIESGIVQLKDEFDNSTASSDPEALYLRHLLIDDGATLDLNGFNVYVGVWDRSAGHGGTVLANGGLISPAYVGDCTFDASVDIFDAFALNAAWGTAAGEAGFDPHVDLNNDGAINIFDAELLNAAWGDSQGDSACNVDTNILAAFVLNQNGGYPGADVPVVPEPNTLLAFAVGLVLLRMARRTDRPR